ncbi:MAG TPA: hypothetical protein EYO73_06255, partial [Sulfurimonas sp.]|nr:hypothetical protein [Sulfurimonas sp.]
MPRLPPNATWLSPTRYASSLFDTVPKIHTRFKVLETDSHDFTSLLHHPHIARVREQPRKSVDIIIRLDNRFCDWHYHHSASGQEYAFPEKLSEVRHFIALRMFHHHRKGIRFSVAKNNFGEPTIAKITNLIKALSQPVTSTNFTNVPTRSVQHVHFANADPEHLVKSNMPFASRHLGGSGTYFSSEQDQALETLFTPDGKPTGNNLMILGKCGTGKTALLKYVIRKFAEHGYNVGVTASTASAASLTKGFTIERFLGIFDVGMHGEELAYNLIQHPEVVKRLCQLDALII